MSDRLSREPRRGRQFWLDHVLHWKTSGLSKVAYCKQHDINVGNFYNWSGKVAKSDTTKPTIDFLPITLTPPRLPEIQRVHVQRAATEVSLPPDLSSDQIQQWLSAIHQLHV